MATGKSLAKRFTDGVSAGIEAGVSGFLQVFKGHDPNTPFRMLLIGETGSGKTSFLNLLYNCGTVQALGCGFGKEGFERFRQFNKFSLENAKETKMASKTDGATLYRVEVGDLKVEIIDTPGFGDSRGLQQDEENAKKIISVLKQQDYINCVCLIINGRLSRMSASLSCVLTEITAILPREILDNVIVVFSNTADALELSFDPVELAVYFGKEVQHIFFVENPYCKFEKAKAKIGQVGIDRVARSLHKSFQDTAEVLTEMCETIHKFPPVHTHHFVQLFLKKEAIEKNLTKLTAAYDTQENYADAIKHAKEEIDTAAKSKTNYEAVARAQKYTEIVPVDKSYYSTLCNYGNCKSNCHEDCSLTKSLDPERFKNCWCMRDGDYCSECGHHYTYHRHLYLLYEQHEKYIVDDDMKKKFLSAKSAEEKAQLLHKDLEQKKEAAEAEKRRLAEDLLKEIDQFEELGLARNYEKVIDNQLAMIQTRLKGKAGAETASLRKTEEALKKKLKIVRDAKTSTE